MDIYRDGDLVVNGREIDQMSDQELEEACRKATVLPGFSQSIR